MTKVMGYIRPFNFSARDREFYKHIRSGQPLTSQRLLEIDYKGALPKGVNATRPNNNVIALKSYFQDRAVPGLLRPAIATVASVLTAGYVHAPSTQERAPGAPPFKFDRSIYLNGLMFSPVGQAGLSYIGYGLLKTVAFAVQLGAPVLMLKALAPLLVLGTSSLRFSPVVQLASFVFRPGMDTVGHEHVHVLQSDDALKRKTGFNALDNFFKARIEAVQKDNANNRRKLDKVLSLGMSGYFLNDYEIQARLHVVMVHGAARWGRLPETRHELWAALIDAGLDAPCSVREELKNSNEPGIRDFYRPGLTTSFNRAARASTDASTAELNVACRAHITGTLKGHFWHDTLPYLYGHMIELYGDPDGRKRMGYGPGDRPWENIPAPRLAA